ncbi:Uncharacterised protein [Serratia fonticola]|uniref:Uncharacterized protein n=1 Tax=Serratia fonticola TaxID=47917 RepID=A0A4U9VH74_SERFO|nr:Uncharacterised protein [Serratia fonticola]
MHLVFIDELGERSFAEVWATTFAKKTHTRHLEFKPNPPFGGASQGMGGYCGYPFHTGLKKYRADEQNRIVQIDIEHWRFESVEFFIDL